MYFNIHILGMPYHKRKRKGARTHFYRPKKNTQAPVQVEEESSFNFETVLSLPISTFWKCISNSSSVQLYEFQVGTENALRLGKAITVKSDLSWQVFINMKQLPTTCRLLRDIPSTVESPSAVMKLLNVVETAIPCPGNPENHFISLVEKRGGSIRSERGSGIAVAYIDTSGQHPSTVRKVGCDLLCERVSSEPSRCKVCQDVRTTLRCANSRQKNAEESNRTQATSHTKYSALDPSEKNARMKSMHKSLVQVKQRNKRLEDKVKELIEKSGVLLQPDDSSDLSSIMNEATPRIEKEFPVDSPQRIFWEQQLQYNSLANKRAIKWHPLVIRFALNLKYLSSTAYRAVRESGIIKLPSERTLTDYTHWTTPHSGVQYEFVEQLKEILEGELLSKPHNVSLSMDEMKIKNGLVFNKHSGQLTGFVDLGSVNADIEKVLSDGIAKTDKTLADHAFVFLARAVFKPTIAIPVAHYFSTSLSGTCIILYNYIYYIHACMHFFVCYI